MLKALRENFKHVKWILWMVIAVFVLFVFVDWGMGTTRTGGGTDTTVAAQAGGIRITTSEFQREYKDAEERYRQLYGNKFTPEMARVMNLPENVLNGLIDRRLMREEAQRLNLKVADDELSAKILAFKDNQNRPIFMRDGRFVGEAQYKRMLAGAGYVPQSFEAATREQILLEKLNRLLTESVVVTDSEVEEDYSGRNVKAKIAYVLLPAKAGPAPSVAEAEAEAYFKQSPAAYMQPEKRRAKYLLVDPAKLKSEIKVTDAEVSAEYSANTETYRKAEQVHARHILYKSESPASDSAARSKADTAVRKLKGGADFAALARAESDDPGSKERGGDLGPFGKGQMVKEFEEAALNAEPKQIVGPVKTAYGYHVIQVLEKLPERVQPIFEVAPSIRARLQDQRGADQARKIAADLQAKLAKMGKPSDDEMKKLTGANVTFAETEYVGKTDAPAGLGFSPAVSQALFGLKPGEIAGPVDTARGPVILKLADVKQPGLPPFVDVKSRVIADLAKKKQEETTATALKQAMATSTDLPALAKALNLKVETPEAFGKNGPIAGLGAARPVLDAAFAANVGDLKGPIPIGDRGAVAIRVVDRTPLDKPAFDKQRDTLRDSLRRQKAERLIQALIQRRRSDLKVEINRDLLARFTGKA